MGEARAKQTRRQRLIEAQPWCVYCGGNTRGDTLDHMPPITIFDNRRRPNDLKFTSCRVCNSGGSPDDQIVGLLSRMFPEPDAPIIDDDLRGAFSGVMNNHPGLLEELRPRDDQIEQLGRSFPGGHAMNASGPIVTSAMKRFGARLGLALHFRSAHRIVSLSGGVGGKWMTNYQVSEHGLPPDLLRLMGPPETLRQGRDHVAGQFLFKSVLSDDGSISAHLATFRRSFAVIAFAAENAERVAWPFDMYRPGFLRDNKKVSTARAWAG